MPALKRAFEAAGFTEVKTVLSSGNVVFTARAASERTLERRAEDLRQDRDHAQLGHRQEVRRSIALA
jgi:uncharacterized protein (DUF1697 family)